MQLSSDTTPSLPKYISLLILLDLIILLSVGLSYKYSALVFLGLVIFFLLVQYPEFTLALIVNGFFVPRLVGAPYGMENELTLFFKITCLSGLLTLWWRHRLTADFVTNPVFFLSLLLGALLFVGTTYSMAPNYGRYKSLNYFLNNIFILSATTFLAYNFKRIKQLLLWVVIFGAVLGFSGLIKLGLGLEEGDRLTVFGVNTIWVSRSLGLSTIVLYFFFVNTSSIHKKLMIIAVAFLLVLAMVFTASRGPVIGLLLSMSVYFLFFSSIPLSRRMVSLAGIILFIILGLLALPEEITSRYLEFGGRRDLSGFLRVVWFNKILPAIRENFFVGVGTGGFSKIITGTDIRTYPHNILAEIGLENGLLGLTTILTILTVTAKYSLNLIKHPEMETEIVHLATTSLLLLIFSTFNAMFSGDIPVNEQIWFAAGLILGLHMYWKKNERAHHLSNRNQLL